MIGSLVARWTTPAIALAAVALTNAASASEPGSGAVSLAGSYTGEAWSTLRGGAEGGGAYLDKLEASLDVDAERALGLQGVRFRVSVLYTNGGSISEKHLGGLQGVSNIEGDGALRLYEAWLQRGWSNGASAKLGVIDLNSEFDVNETGGLFLNSAQGIAPDFSQAGANGPSIFPVTGLGLVVAGPLPGGWSVKAGAFDGLPGDLDRPRHNVFRVSTSDGAVLAAEAAWSRGEGPRVALGAWAHTRWGRQDIRANDPPRAAGVYGIADLPLSANGASSLDSFIRAGVAKDGEIAGYLGAGLVWTGPLMSREEDRVGLAIGLARLSDRHRRAQAEMGQTLEWGEAHAELTYRAQLTPWAALQPSLQYIRNPGAAPGVRDAWVVGLRAQVSGEHRLAERNRP